MVDLNKINSSKGYKNYKSLDAALSILGQYLESFTVQSVESVHNKVYQKLGVQPQCNQQCSRAILNQKRWCPTCIAWKHELTKYLKNPKEKLNWDRMESWMWPVSSDHIREVFMPSNWKLKDISFKDLSTIINIWKRCKEVNARIVNAIDRLRKLRNSFTHRYGSSLQIDDTEMNNKFLIIFNVLTHPDIRAAIPNYNYLTKTMKDLEQFGMDTDVEKSLIQIQSTLDRMLEENQKKIKGSEHIYIRKKHCLLAVMCVLLAVAVIFLVKWCPNTAEHRFLHQIHIPSTEIDCLSEDPIQPFANKYVRMLEYLSHHHSFVGRQWMFQRLEESLKQNNKGAVLITDMGFGKSAAMANVICANSSDASYNLRKRLIAYHICRFDSLITKKHFVFKRRLSSMIAKSIPKFSDVLKYDYTSCIDNYDEVSCEHDRFGCFDDCLVYPLRSLPEPKEDFKLVIIDALDECEDNQGSDSKKHDRNGIASLLKYRVHLLPKWFKFMITCRNVWYCRQLKSNMNLVILNSSDERNIKDINSYLHDHGFNETDMTVEPATFLLAKGAVQSNTNIEQFQTLDMFYEHQFKRYFASNYEHTKVILEIICSSLQPVDKDKMWYIISNTTAIEPEDYEYSITHLIHFVRFTNNETQMLHVSLKDWLLDNENVEFKINLNTGHYFNALYLLDVFKENREKIDIVKLALHIVQANPYKDPKVQDVFSSLISRNVIEIDRYKDDYPLHYIAKHEDSAMATKYLLKLFPTVDTLNRQNVTPAYIAALAGHVGVLKVLTTAGADLGFRTNSFQDIIHLDIAVKVSFEKLHWDYGLLDIAVQNGRYQVVEFILNDQKSFKYPLNRRNGMNLLPIHLACKLGHFQIVKYMVSLYPKMLDKTCLYFAAEGGHADLVNFIRHYVTDDCKPCGPKPYWIPTGKIRIQSEMIVSNVETSYQMVYVLYDDWHLIACETALHVAVRLGHVNVVKVLLDNPNTSSHKCIDRGGRIPLISAIQYNHLDIVKLFIDKNIFRSDTRCSKSTNLSHLYHLNDKERQNLKSYVCPHEFSVLHIVSKYDRFWIIDMLQEKDIKIMWNITDDKGCFPIHVAACHGSFKILEYLVKRSSKKLHEIKCKNGNSPVESASECGSFSASSFLRQHLSSSDIVFRRHKIAVISTALSNSLTSSFSSDDFYKASNVSKIVELFLDTEEDSTIRYSHKRNILHMSLLNGHYQVLSDMFSRFTKSSIKLMRDKDIDSITPLRLAVSNLEKSTEFMFTSLLDITIESTKSLLTSKEYSILLAFEFAEKHGLISRIERKSLLSNIVEKNHCSLVALYVRFINKEILKDYEFIGNVLLKDYTSILTFEIYLISTIEKQLASADIIMCALNCKTMITKCHLHMLALKFGQLSSLMFDTLGKLYFSSIMEVLENMFGMKINVYSSCYDSDGFNILERAIQGGSPFLVKHLLGNVKSNRSVRELISLALNTSYRNKYEKFYFLLKPHKNGSFLVKLLDKNYMRESLAFALKYGYDKVTIILADFFKSYKYVSFQNIPRSYTDLDTIVSSIIIREKSYLTKSIFCSQNNTHTLSWVHVFAMHDMFLTLSNISYFFGKNVLNCRNFHSITPMYLATSLRQQNTQILFKEMSIQKVDPSKTDEQRFIFHFWIRFVFKIYENEKINCIFRFQKHMPRNMHTIFKASKCFTYVAKVIGVREKLNDRLEFLEANYKLLRKRNLCYFKGINRLRKLISLKKYKDVFKGVT